MGRILMWTGVFLLLVTSAWADVYEWIDDQGMVNFTDNLQRVPAKYRQKVRLRESIDGEKPQATPAPPPPVSTQEPKPTQELFGGHDLSWWRKEYRSLSQAINELTADLAKAREDVTVARRKKLILQRAKDREALSQKKEELAAKDAKLGELQKQLVDLEGAAERAGVPIRWRE